MSGYTTISTRQLQNRTIKMETVFQTYRLTILIY